MKALWGVLGALALGLFGYLVFSIVGFTDRADRSLADIADSERHESPRDIKTKSRLDAEARTFGDPVRAVVSPVSGDGEGHVARIVVRDAQVRRLIELGFHASAGLSEQDFAKLAQMPDDTDAVLVVSEALVSIGEQCRLLGIANALEADPYQDLFSDRSAKLYWRYGADAGGYMLGKSVVEARGALMERERIPASVTELLALYREDSSVGIAWGVDAAGTVYGEERNPYLWHDKEKQRLELGVGLSDRRHPRWGSASFAK